MEVFHAASRTLSSHIGRVPVDSHHDHRNRLQQRDLGLLFALLSVFRVRVSERLVDGAERCGFHHGVRFRVRGVFKTNRPL